jgi:hypothetical protein
MVPQGLDTSYDLSKCNHYFLTERHERGKMPRNCALVGQIGRSPVSLSLGAHKATGKLPVEMRWVDVFSNCRMKTSLTSSLNAMKSASRRPQ